MNERDAFWMTHSQRYSEMKQSKCAVDIDLLDVRRVVFVSFTGLFRTWQQTPSYVLRSCLIIAPTDSAWLTDYKQSKYKNAILGHLYESVEALENFIRFMRLKHDQGLVVWSGTQFDVTDADDLMAPFWKHVSAKLANLHDPLTRRNYAPLKALDFWSSKSRSKPFLSQYGVNKCKVFAELVFATLNFKAMQEILYQSNPESLNPITCYCPENINTSVTKQTPASVVHLTDDIDQNGFWVSPDYFDTQSESEESSISGL